MNYRALAANLILAITATLMPLIALEYAFRLIRLIANKPPYYQSNSLLGWAPAPNVDIKGMPVISADGSIYKIDYSTDIHGMRYSDRDWDVDPFASSYRHKILVLGDSFTGDAYTSDSDAWFAYLNKELALPVYAYGIGGSGTYQQYLALKKLLPLVKPRLIVLQACSNDHDNNNPSLIFSSNVRNQELRRPYLSAAGNPFYAQGLYARVYRFLFGSSQLFAFIDNQLAKKQVVFPFYSPSTLAEASSALLAHGGSPEGLTKASLRLLVEESRSYNKSVKVIGVLCASDQASWWRKSFAEVGIAYIHDPVIAVEEAERGGSAVRINDRAHWNVLGNKIFGQELARRLKVYLD